MAKMTVNKKKKIVIGLDITLTKILMNNYEWSSSWGVLKRESDYERRT